jgi:hypothetical protein
MQNRPLLSDIDLFPAEHRIDSCPQSRLTGQLKQQLDGLVGNAILGIVEVQPHSLRRQTRASLGIIRKQLSEV